MSFDPFKGGTVDEWLDHYIDTAFENKDVPVLIVLSHEMWMNLDDWARKQGFATGLVAGCRYRGIPISYRKDIEQDIVITKRELENGAAGRLENLGFGIKQAFE